MDADVPEDWPEAKKIDRAQNTLSFSNDVPGIVALNLCATGSDYTNRNGRKIIMEEVSVLGIVRPVDATAQPTLARLLLVFDRQTNGALPAITDILDASTSISSWNLNNRDRFEILEDISWPLTESNVRPLVYIHDVCYALNHTTVYGGTGAAITDVQSGSLLLVTVGDDSAVNAGIFKFTTRVRFYDG